MIEYLEQAADYVREKGWLMLVAGIGILLLLSVVFAIYLIGEATNKLTPEQNQTIQNKTVNETMNQTNEDDELTKIVEEEMRNDDAGSGC